MDSDQLKREREASRARQAENDTRTRSPVSKPMGSPGTKTRQPLGDGGYLVIPSHSEEG